MKVSIIGGGGLVGSCTAFALQTGRIVREIALLDANADMAAGQALDLLHGSPLMADQVISSGGYEQIPDSDLICITAGLRRKPDESRLDLINRNVDLFLGILGEIQKAGTSPTRSCSSSRTRSTCSPIWRRERLESARRPRARPGHAARHDPLPQLDRRTTRRRRRRKSRP